MFPPMFESDSRDTDFLALLTERLHAIIGSCGLKRTVDTNLRSPRSSPLTSMFALNQEAIDELRTEAWDDRPAIEKIFHVLLKPQVKRAPEPVTVRILTHLPGTCTVAVMLVAAFTPIFEGEEWDLTKVGRWSVALRDVGGQVSGANTTRNWQGDVLDRQELQDALDGVQAACARYRDAYKLQPIAQRGDGFGQFVTGLGVGDPGSLGGYVDSPRLQGQAGRGDLPVAEPQHEHDGPQG